MAIRVIEKPYTRRSIVGLVWGGSLLAFMGGLFLGAVLAGLLGDGLTEGPLEENVFEAGIAAFTLPAGAIGLLLTLGRRAGLGILSRAALFLLPWLAGVAILYGARDAEDLRYMAQIRAWFGSPEATMGVGLLAAGVILAIVLSFRRPAAGEGG
jgi:hypothetical protein